jgi:hypothetical protein
MDLMYLLKAQPLNLLLTKDIWEYYFNLMIINITVLVLVKSHFIKIMLFKQLISLTYMLKLDQLYLTLMIAEMSMFKKSPKNLKTPSTF